MATILIKRSAVSASVPVPGNLSDGELAVNTTDGGLYYLNAADGTVRLLRASSSISSSYAITASYAANAGGAPSVSASYATTSSYALSASWAPGSGTSTSASYSTTSSYAVTASFAVNVIPQASASYATTASYAVTASYVSGSSASSVSASYATTSSYALSSSWAPGSGISTSASYATTSSYAVLAQTLLGTIVSASYAITASYAVLYETSSLISVISASYAESASWAPGSGTSTSASYATTSSYALSSSWAPGSGTSTSASYAITASYAANAGSGSGTYYLGAPTRTVTTLMIPSLGASASANYERSGSVPFGSSFYLFNVSSSLISRVRLYSSESYLNVDKTRAIGVDPTGEHGVMLDLVMSGSASYQVYNLAPPIVGFDASPSQTGSITYLISNLTAGTSDITMSFTHVNIESSVISANVPSASYAITSSYGRFALSSSYALTSSYAMSMGYPFGEFANTASILLNNIAIIHSASFDTDLHKVGFTHTPPSTQITVAESGFYIIAVHAICDETTNANAYVQMWIRINGANVANSGVRTQIPSLNAEIHMGSSYIHDFNAGDILEIGLWGNSVSTRLVGSAAGVSPTRPANPAITLTITKIAG